MGGSVICQATEEGLVLCCCYEESIKPGHDGYSTARSQKRMEGAAILRIVIQKAVETPMMQKHTRQNAGATKYNTSLARHQGLVSSIRRTDHALIKYASKCWPNDPKVAYDSSPEVPGFNAKRPM